MQDEKIFFQPYIRNGFDGFTIPVRNSFNSHIEYEYIPFEARMLYEQRFGENIISDQEFLTWYTESVEEFN